MVERIIIVLWDFAEDTSSLPTSVEWKKNKDQIKYMILHVGSDNKDLLAAIILPNVIHADAEFKAILKLASDIAKGKDHIILVHKNTKVGERKIITKDSIIDKHPKMNYELFGDGDGEIYKQLLSTKETFSKNVFGDLGEVKKTVFKAMWNEYNVKKKLVKLKYNILSDFCPIVIDMRGLKEYAERKSDTKIDGYFEEIKENKNWVPPSEDYLSKKGDWPSDGLRKEIEAAINQIAFLGEIIKKSKVSQDVIDEMKNKQFNIDDWYSELGECFERYT